jgi:hypothetical protein
MLISSGHAHAIPFFVFTKQIRNTLQQVGRIPAVIVWETDDFTPSVLETKIQRVAETRRSSHSVDIQRSRQQFDNLIDAIVRVLVNQK